MKPRAVIIIGIVVGLIGVAAALALLLWY